MMPIYTMPSSLYQEFLLQFKKELVELEPERYREVLQKAANFFLVVEEMRPIKSRQIAALTLATFALYAGLL